MPSAEGRALSLQAQHAQEIIVDNTVRAVEAMFTEYARPNMTEPQKREFAGLYVALVLAGTRAVAGVRAAYLSAYARAEGQALTIPAGASTPALADVLTEQARTEAAAYASLARLDQLAAKAASEYLSVTVPATSVRPRIPQPRPVDAATVAVDHAAAAALAGADYVDTRVLGRVRNVVAFRRVVHPTACVRCRAVAGVLVFAHKPRPRHPQCRCSFEPVFIGDADYQARLARYRANVESRYSEARSRGRAQEAAARQRETSAYQREVWAQFMADEQQRLATIVKTIPSTTYRNWAVLVSANITESGARGLLPVIERK